MDISLNSTSSREVLQLVKKFFGDKNLDEAQNHLARGRISISFQKGDLTRFLIVSGLVQDGGNFEARITYKKNDEYPEGMISTSCSCIEWTKENHCSHTATIFYKYLLSQNQKENLSGPQERSVSDIILLGNGVHVERFGTIFHSARYLKGAYPSSTFASLQYILTNRKIINLPLAQKFKGKIIISLLKGNSDERNEIYHLKDNEYEISLSYQDESNKTHTKISLFEYLYIFNWETGECFYQPDFMQTLVKRLRQEDHFLDLNYALSLFSPHEEKDEIILKINNINFKDLPYSEPKLRFQILQSDRRGFLDFFLEIFNKENILITPPKFFSILSMENGLLSSFRTKNDASLFIKDLVSSIRFDTNDYKKHLFGENKKNLAHWLSPLFEKNNIVFTTSKGDELYFIETKLLKNLICSIFETFDESLIKSSALDTQRQRVLFKISKNNFFESISHFFERISTLNIPIYYEDKEIKKWSASIRFERNKTNLDWFELNLLIGEKDLSIIKNSKLEDNYIVSNEGLVILSKNESDLLKFMKKYTSFEADGTVLTEEKISRFSLNIKRSRIFELFELKKYGITGALTEEEENLCNNLLHLEKMPEYEVPNHYSEIARPYQLHGFQWLRFLFENKFGACLADDMGLGKTLQTIMFLQSVIDRVDKVLIVCPVSILLNWKSEIEKFSKFDVYVYYGGEREFDSTKKVILTSYGVMKKESYTTFQDEAIDILVMDEVQHLKNIKSIGANAARNLKAKFRICLTGTPVENDLSEFYNILDLCIPGIWGGTSFIKTTSTKKSRLLARKTVKPFILRRTKDQVLKELPEKEEHHVFLSFSEEEEISYKENLERIKISLLNTQTHRKYGEILKNLLKLRQLCLWQDTGKILSTKIDFLMETLEQILSENHKVLVFSQFTTYLDIIQNRVRAHSYRYTRIDGTQSFKKRAEEVERFQNGDAQVFLISLKAGGVGLNLTAASYIFLMDPWWNPAVERQAIDRAHRIGQENKVTVYRPIIKNSVEEKVLILQNSKRELFKDLMAQDEDSYFNGKLSKDDFESLIS